MKRTLNQIRIEGFSALQGRLGKADMIRFIQQFDQGKGNYAVTRRKWVDSTSLTDIRNLAKKGQNRRK
jgi:hypothetical protein